MKILVFGRNGQVAGALGGSQWPESWRVTYLGRDACDLSQPGSAARAIRSASPDIVINAAAYTAVDAAEGDADAADRINRAAPAEMAAAAARSGGALIHLSTDYVFDGAATRPCLESDARRPLSVYGATKAAGEDAIRENLPRHVIIRTSWVFSSEGTNFVKTMLRLGRERDELRVVGDQYGGPTYADDIAAAILIIANGLATGKTGFGIYHYAGAPATSWFEFAQAIFARAAARGCKVPRIVQRIATSDYPTPARRPLNSTLDCSAILREWGVGQPSWEGALDRCLDALTSVSPTR